MSNSTEMEIKNNKVGWESPSNIAIIKYWGKYGNQLPQNASVSFTLKNAATRTFVEWRNGNTTGKPECTFSFEGKENPAFKARLDKFLNSICHDFFPFLQHVTLHIDSSNSFPHSSGIASSASAMSALALCLCDIENQINGVSDFNESFYKKSSIVSRLGSGSACRSVYPYMAVWGKHQSYPDASDEYAIPAESSMHPVFKSFHDDILIVSADQKSVSSSAGHGLMENNPFAKARYIQAENRMRVLSEALNSGDIGGFGKIAEEEALTLHALMMCSDPSYILMEENSLAIIKKVKQFRQDSGIPVYFTLDAGPNVHVLYPDEFEKKVSAFIYEELKPFCYQGKILRDEVGKGPQKIC